MLKSVRDLTLELLIMNSEMNPLNGDGNTAPPMNSFSSEPAFQENIVSPQLDEQLIQGVEPAFQESQGPADNIEPAFQIDEQMPSANQVSSFAQNNESLPEFGNNPLVDTTNNSQSNDEIYDASKKEQENILVERTPVEEEEFHKDQEVLFQQMSKNFALGKDQDAIEMREQLKRNVGEEYSRLTVLLEYVPPKLPELQEDIRNEMKGLEKSLEDNNREGFSGTAKKLWGLRDEMQEVSKMVVEKRKITEKKIEDFKKRYGNLVPGASA